MNYEVTVKDDKGNSITFNLESSEVYEENNLNDFILEALSISENKRKLPLLIATPNWAEVYPSIKMKMEQNEVTGMYITWRE